MKTLILILIVVLGAIIVDFVDRAIGIDFSAVSFWAHVAHITTCLVWGGLITADVANIFRKRPNID